jgi:hypothetical protein
MIEYWYLRESLMQCACYERGLCKGGSSFEEMAPLRGFLNDGQLLVDGQLSPGWMQVLFWRSFIATTLHYMAILCTLSMCLKRGFLTNYEESQKMDDILDRPSDDNVDVYAKIKQPIYQRALAYNRYNVDKVRKYDSKCL